MRNDHLNYKTARGMTGAHRSGSDLQRENCLYLGITVYLWIDLSNRYRSLFYSRVWEK
jgi:hypothetical protein